MWTMTELKKKILKLQLKKIFEDFRGFNKNRLSTCVMQFMKVNMLQHTLKTRQLAILDRPTSILISVLPPAASNSCCSWCVSALISLTGRSAPTCCEWRSALAAEAGVGTRLSRLAPG